MKTKLARGWGENIIEYTLSKRERGTNDWTIVSDFDQVQWDDYVGDCSKKALTGAGKSKWYWNGGWLWGHWKFETGVYSQ
jgi:hypothetical protein